MSYSPPKNAWSIVARREIMRQLKDKTFWISTLVTLAMVGLGFGLAMWTGGSSDTTKVAVADERAAQVVASAQGDFEAVTVSEDKLNQTVLDEDADMALRATDSGWEVLTENITSNSAMALSNAASSYQLAENAAAAGVDKSVLMANTEATITLISTDDPSGGENALLATIMPMVFGILFLLAAFTYGMQIAASVLEEKENRIVEILAAAIPTRQLLIGKVVGNSLMALLQLGILVGAAAIAVNFTDFKDLLPQVAPSMGWFLVFFLFGFAALACLWAAAGALATKQADLSNTTLPLTMLVMIPYFVGLTVTGSIAKIVSYIPIFSTVMMPKLLLTGDATWVDALIALALVTVFMILTIWFGERIYRRGIMHTSGTMKLSQAMKSAA